MGGGRQHILYLWPGGEGNGNEDALIPVKTMICPDFLSRIAGSAALIILTGPKKFVSNWFRTRVWVLGDAASSSTVPITAETMGARD